MDEILFIVGCLAFSTLFFLLALRARNSARKLRKENLLSLDKFHLDPLHLSDLKSRNNFSAKNRKKLSETFPDYALIKESIRNYLTEDEVYKSMELCVFSIIRSKLTRKIFSCPIANLKMKELNTMMINMRERFSEENSLMLNQAVLFELRERTMLTPFSLIGSRVFQILADVWKHAKEEKDGTNNCNLTSRENVVKSFESIHSFSGQCLACNSGYHRSVISRGLRLIALAGKTVVVLIARWLADNVTDVLFFLAYAQSVGDPILPAIKPNDQNSLSELVYPLVVIAVVMSLSSLAFIFSLFSCTSYIPRILLRPLAVHHMMDDTNLVEDVDKLIYSDSLGQSWIWQPGDVATRYQFSLSEAGAESVGQFVCQWALFLSVGFILNHMQEDKRPLHSPLSWEALRNSTIASLLSLTASQNKTMKLSHEFSINNKQKLLYVIASFLNTFAVSTILICYTTYSFDLIVLANYKYGYIISMVITFAFTLSYFLVSFIANRFTLTDMTELGSINAMPGGMGNHSTSTTFIMPVVIFLNFTDNLFNSLRLPTSSYCLQTHYTTNHNQVNAKTLGMTARHFFTICIYFLLIAILCSNHTILLKFDQTFDFMTHLPSEEWEVRETLMIFTMTAPVCILLALFFSWCFLSFPQFEANLHFWWMKDTNNNIGIWEDLGPATFTFLNYLGLTTP